jgi:tRNA-2-methylthio-N6-dimethylallyladenosine synthase
MSFSSDFIVGFPGETKDDFQKTINIINAVKFDESYSFIYSPRPNTTAAEMPDDVPFEEKKDRLDILQSRLNQLSFGFSRKKVGTIQNCLIYGQSRRDPGQLQGRTICNRIVNFKSNNMDLVGNFTKIKIQEALTNSLRGNLEN